MYDTHFAGMHAALQGSTLIDFTMYEAADRFYASNLGRWHSPDPIGEKAVRLDDPQTWNMYAYARDNPTTLTDPSGSCAGTGAFAETSGSRNEGLCQTRDLHAGEGQGQTVTVTLQQNSIAPIVLTITYSPVADTAGNNGMTIEVTPTNCDNCKWVQTVNSSVSGAQTDFNPSVASPADPAPILGNTSGRPNGQNILHDSPSFNPARQNASDSFVSTIGYTEGNKFVPQGSITWGFTVSGGKVTPLSTPRESTASEQAGSFQLIRKEYPSVLPPQ